MAVDLDTRSGMRGVANDAMVACIDPVTQLGNAAMLERDLRRAVARFYRMAEPFSLMLIQTDDPYADDFSRQTVMARVLAESLREEDQPCHIQDRWFGVMLAGATEQGARSAFDRIRSLTDWQPGRPVMHSAIGGVAAWNRGYDTIDELMAVALADLMLSWDRAEVTRYTDLPPLLLRALQSRDWSMVSSTSMETAPPRAS